MNRKDRVMESFRQFALSRDFSWENYNCVSFSTELIKAVSNKEIKGTPNILGNSKREFIKILKDNKMLLSDYATQQYGEPLSSPELATKGDLVIEGAGLRQNMGIYYGNSVAYFLGEKGLIAVDLKECTFAWRIE